MVMQVSLAELSLYIRGLLQTGILFQRINIDFVVSVQFIKLKSEKVPVDTAIDQCGGVNNIQVARVRSLTCTNVS